MLQIQNQTQTFEEVQKGNTPLPHPAWKFCHEWLNGKQLFEQQTSGSTGKPKIIQIQRAQMQASAKATIKAIGLKENDNLLVCINTNYIGGKMMLVRGMEGKMNLHVIEASGNPLKSFDESSFNYQFTALVPLQMEQILKESPEKISLLNQMKGIIIGGATVSTSLETKIQHVKCPVYSTYGMTETVSHIALRRLNPPEDFYTTLPETKIRQDERGCLVINAPVTLNQEVITNDLAELISEEKFKWLGRADFTINSGGIKIQPEQLEAKISPILTQLKIHSDFVIIPQDDEALGQKAVLVIESNQLNAKSLKQSLKASLDKYEAPKEIIFFPTFPRTPNRKINRKALIAQMRK